MEIQDGGGRHLEKYTNGYISANSWTICSKFGVLIDTGNISVIRGPKCHFLKIQDGGGGHLGKFTKVRIWANSRPIYTKFGVLIDMVNLSVISVKNSTFRKFKMAAAAILNNTQCISANSLSICTKFGMLIGRVDTSVIRSPKCHFLENQDGGRRHSGKYTKGHISANSWSICTKFRMLVDIGNVGVQNSTFWKFKIAVVAVLEIHKRVYLGQFLTNLH